MWDGVEQQNNMVGLLKQDSGGCVRTDWRDGGHSLVWAQEKVA